MPETPGPESKTTLTVQRASGELASAAPSTLHPTRIALSASEGGVDAGIAMEIARGEHEMRRDLATGVLKIFVLGNSAIWILVIMLVAVDVILIATGHQSPRDRVIDRGVVKTLVGSTAVQVGFIMVAIASNLFPKARADGKSWWKLWG